GGTPPLLETGHECLPPWARCLPLIGPTLLFFHWLSCCPLTNQLGCLKAVTSARNFACVVLLIIQWAPLTPLDNQLQWQTKLLQRLLRFCPSPHRLALSVAWVGPRQRLVGCLPLPAAGRR